MAGLPCEITSWLMPIEFDTGHLLHEWIGWKDTGNKGPSEST